ncbi:MAG: nuclear transport factor 2 family protein [Hyphomonadaceae bacterium]|nr:nuclear transport factor 2 family protein [Hyphomonadaceae bacterium]
MPEKLSLSDRADITDLLARYCVYLDEGEADAWLDLWLDDGVFAGASPQPLRGRQALAQLPVRSLSTGSRHLLGNIVADYGASKDEIVVRCYNLVTSWLGGGRFNSMAIARYELVRVGDSWKIRSNRIRRMMPGEPDPNMFPEGFCYPADQPTKFPPV